MSASRTTAGRDDTGLTPAGIAAAALDLMLSVGVAGVTMRALADELGVRAPSLYHHLRNKDELLELVASQVFGLIDFDPAVFERVRTVDDWLEAERSACRTARDFYRVRPGLAAVMLRAARPGRERLDNPRGRSLRGGIDALVRLGMPPARARRLNDAGARWMLAAVAAGDAGEDARRESQLFEDGLELLLLGCAADIERARR